MLSDALYCMTKMKDCNRKLIACNQIFVFTPLIAE